MAKPKFNPNPPFDVNTIIRCGTTEYMNMLKASDPTLQGRLDDFEAKMQEYIKIINPPPPPVGGAK